MIRAIIIRTVVAPTINKEKHICLADCVKPREILYPALRVPRLFT